MTSSPSSTFSSMILPMTSALMSTALRALTFPLTVTVATRSRVTTSSIRTGDPPPVSSLDEAE